MDAFVAALGTQLQGRTVLDQRRHLADVFERLIVANQRALAVFTDGKDRRRRFENNRRATGWTGGSDSHSAAVNSVF